MKWPDRSTLSDGLAALIILGVAAWLFRDHLLGFATFLGNPDRLNHSLKVAAFYVDGIMRGHIDAWNEAEMMGYDSFVQPYAFPNPISYFLAEAGPENAIVNAGYVSFTLLALSGLVAFRFCRSFSGTTPSLTAAILYQCSALSILKVSQNDMSFMVVVLVPALALFIRRARESNALSTFLCVTAVVFFILQFCFVQKAAYAAIFAVSYAAFICWETRDRYAMATLAAAGLLGSFAAAPRWIGMAQASREYVRVQPDWTFNSFADIFRYQGIEPYQILRWFDEGIFGPHFAHPVAVSNGLNLSEGFLLYTSAMVPVVVVSAMASRHQGWRGAILGRPSEARFFLWFLLLTFAVALLEPFAHVFYLAFLRIDFFHARFLVVGLLPLVAYLALRLENLRPPSERQDAGALPPLLWAIALSVAAIAVTEMLAAATTGTVKAAWLTDKDLDFAAVVRAIIYSAIGISLLTLLACKPFGSSGRRKVLHMMLCVLPAMQALVAADYRLNGEHTRDPDIAFKSGGLYSAPRGDFRRPAPAQREALQLRVERDDFRSVIVCDKASAGGFCAGHVGQFWGLRLVDGYYGIGVPARLAALPWGTEIGLRHIVFTDSKELPWRLLGLLNVKYAVVNDIGLYRNRGLPSNTPGPVIIKNPEHVVPRAFFTAHVEPASGPAEARAAMDFGLEAELDPALRTIVEGISGPSDFPADDRVRISGGGDFLNLQFPPSSRKRFLVVNELWSDRWTASIGGQAARIYPANLVMRGIAVPPGATDVQLSYQPYVRSKFAIYWYGIAFVGAISLMFLILRRRDGRKSARSERRRDILKG